MAKTHKKRKTLKPTASARSYAKATVRQSLARPQIIVIQGAPGAPGGGGSSSASSSGPGTGGFPQRDGGLNYSTLAPIVHPPLQTAAPVPRQAAMFTTTTDTGPNRVPMESVGTQARPRTRNFSSQFGPRTSDFATQTALLTNAGGVISRSDETGLVPSGTVIEDAGESVRQSLVPHIGGGALVTSPSPMDMEIQDLVPASRVTPARMTLVDSDGNEYSPGSYMRLNGDVIQRLTSQQNQLLQMVRRLENTVESKSKSDDSTALVAIRALETSVQHSQINAATATHVANQLVRFQEQLAQQPSRSDLSLIANQIQAVNSQVQQGIVRRPTTSNTQINYGSRLALPDSSNSGAIVPASSSPSKRQRSDDDIPLFTRRYSNEAAGGGSVILSGGVDSEPANALVPIPPSTLSTSGVVGPSPPVLQGVAQDPSPASQFLAIQTQNQLGTIVPHDSSQDL